MSDAAINHSGDPLPGGLEIYAPPDDIGPVISVDSNVRVGQKAPSVFVRLPRALWMGIVLALMAGVGAAVLFGFIQWMFEWLPPPEVVVGIAGFTLLFGTWAGFSQAGIGGMVTYVGRDGLAEFHFRGKPSDTTPQSKLAFADAVKLTTDSTRHLRPDQSYSHTSYAYRWYGEHDVMAAFEITGECNMEEGPPAGHAYHFAPAAEKAWNEFLLARAQESLKEQGHVEFDLDLGRKLRVGAGFLEFVAGDKTDRIEQSNIAELSVKAGHFTLKRGDAKEGFFASDGVYHFEYSNIANASFFLIALELLAGLRFS